MLFGLGFLGREFLWGFWCGKFLPNDTPRRCIGRFLAVGSFWGFCHF